MKVKKDELMFKDEKAILNTQNELSIASAKLNEYLQMVQKFFGSDSDIDFSNLLNLSTADLHNELKKKFPFPNASDQFNYEALGMNPGSLFTFFNNHSTNWNRFNFDFKEGKFVPTEDQPEISKHYFYADTEERKRVSGLIAKTKDLLQELEASNLYNSQRGLFLFDVEGFSNMNSLVFRMFVKDIDKGKFNEDYRV